jgi:hypothetical protein
MVYIDLYDLVGGIPTPLKNMKVTWIMTFPIYIYMEKENIFQTTNQGTLVPYFRP